MAPLPRYRPRQLALGPLEQEILAMLWQRGSATVKELLDEILADPDRDLSQATVTTVLQRLANKGWVRREPMGVARLGKGRKGYVWHPQVNQQEATMLQSHRQLEEFLAISNPEIVAAFADSLDTSALDRLDAIARRIRSMRDAQGGDDPCI
ncbi:BlaI/MecI/CopY family transcriptional regulator [Phormidium sp. FACHB-1136]|uniref:BlaI/MecI/CopY family transcriptional regulator n=1 Tax=Phormidium sp. FACHB-1136 TaxID=2692848 RepID=UPI0016839DA4|nr:BlaI/MecI/CopY family transcriptional regulator [Phormidium sp. FACHB-1136]MBD2424409.1 BlaI/MecI/CopY family transcriptional regulator [Phormidium sp. FACHB-1136]